MKGILRYTHVGVGGVNHDGIKSDTLLCQSYSEL